MARSMQEKHIAMLKAYISTLNNMIQELKENDIHIHDDNDFDFAIDHIYYSKAQDKVIFKTEQVENIIEGKEEQS